LAIGAAGPLTKVRADFRNTPVGIASRIMANRKTSVSLQGKDIRSGH
jgi:hypothetical protein